MSIIDKIEEFEKNTSIPTDEEINKLADYWESYILQEDPLRGQNCRKDFAMGLIVMGKRLNKNENNNNKIIKINKKHPVANCELCQTGESGFKFCSGKCVEVENLKTKKNDK